MNRVESIVPELERILGATLDVDTAVQDASFFTEIALHRPARNPGYTDAVVGVRFSSFGNLFTVWSSCSFEGLPASAVEQVVAAVEEHGFHYVDEEALAQPYTGVNPAFTSSTWGYRYLDYL